MREKLEKAIQSYLISKYGETSPASLKYEIRQVRLAFEHGWWWADTEEQRLQQLAVQSLSRRTGCGKCCS